MDAFDLPTLEPVGEVIQSPGAAEQALEEQRLALLEEAKTRGHAEGFAAGQAEGRQMLMPVLEALQQAVEGVQAQRDQTSAVVEAAAVDLAMQVAEQVLAGQLDAQPGLVVEVVRGALRRLVERERVTVLVNPDDLDLMRAAAAELAGELGGIEHCEVQAERRVARGGALVRTTEGEIDATIRTKLERVREVLAAGGAKTGPDA